MSKRPSPYLCFCFNVRLQVSIEGGSGDVCNLLAPGVPVPPAPALICDLTFTDTCGDPVFLLLPNCNLRGDPAVLPA